MKGYISYLLALTVFFSFYSCEEPMPGKFRYVAVRVENDELWSILDTENGEILDRAKFRYAPAIGADGIFFVADGMGYFRYFAVDETDEPITDKRYTQPGLFNGGVTLAVEDGGTIKVVDRDLDVVRDLQGSVAQAMEFSDGLAAIFQAGKWGFVNTDGDVVIEPAFMQVMPFSEEIALASVGERLLMINRSGEEIASFDGALYGFEGTPVFSEGVCPLVKGKTVVFVDREGYEVLADVRLRPDEAYGMHGGRSIFFDGNGYGIMSRDGKVVVNAQYFRLCYLAPSRFAAVNKEGRCGVIDGDGKAVLPFAYDDVVQVSSSLNHYFVAEGGLWRLVDEEGKDVSRQRFSEFSTTETTLFYNESSGFIEE